jgi:prevent-host-death family protein
MEVGVRELKARLSEYLDRAERGEIIRVTERGRPKAMLVPLPGKLRIEEGIAEGWITPPKTKTRRRRQIRPVKADRSIAEILAEDRGE